MALDFFTVTEMKEGLTAPARVKELVNVMLEGRDFVLKNVGDASAQWSTLARTIATTEDKECLDLFVQLDGISFINKWLEDAQKLGNEASDSSTEESIADLLHAVEKLHINYEQSVAYGIRATVEKLLSHNSISIREKARVLFDSWNQLIVGEAITNIGGEGGQMSSSAGDSQPSMVVPHEKHFKAGGDMVLPMCSNDVMSGKVDDIETRIDNKVKTLHHENMKDEGSEGECRSRDLEGNASNSTSTVAVPKEDEMVFNQFSDNKEQTQVVASLSDELGAVEVSPCPLENSQTDIIKMNSNSKELASGDMRTDISSPSKDISQANVDRTQVKHSEIVLVSQNQGGVCDANILVDSGNEDRLPKLENPITSSLREDSDSTSSENGSSESWGLTSVSECWKIKTKDNDVVNKNRSDFELKYGIIDALEVARQVANEVEREVEGQTETSCSSSQKNLEIETRHPDSPASVHGSETQPEESAPKEELPNDQNGPNVASSQVPNCVQEPESKPDKVIVDFDLNQEICSDDTNHPLDSISTPVSIVSASRAVAAPGFPASPLQFEGAHGWKGSAATSAFRPASARKVPDSDKIDNTLKHRQSFLDFDLNMSEDRDNEAADLLSRRQILHFGESSGEAKLNLDLNQISDEGDAPPSNWRMNGRLLLGRNGYHNASPSSSSSSMQQPLRNFDLNDQPSFVNDSSELNFFAKLSSSQKMHSSVGIPRSSDGVISIMGTKVAVNQKDFSPHPPFFPNDRILEPAPDAANLTRNGGVVGIGSTVPYPHPAMLTYNGLTTGPTGTFSPVMYGPGRPIHYMVDSRGAPVLPQFLGSASAAPGPYSQTPFAAPGIYGLHPPSLNGPGPGREPLRPNFELNLGFVGERENRESGGLRQFLGPGPIRPLDELRSSFQSSSSFGLGKRKEPDAGWEPYPFDYKHHYPHWK